jgi:ribonuclease HI
MCNVLQEILLLLQVNIDGASRGNPGLSAIGIIARDKETTIIEHSEYIGIKTNNQSEYEALRRALEICKEIDSELTILSDSELLINQRNLKYRIRNQELKIISREITNLEKNFEKILYKHIPREKNNFADKLANKAIDEYIKETQKNKNR